MKAAVLMGIENIIVKEVPEPLLPNKGFIMKVETCAICATDIKMYEFGYANINLPLIPGHELAGIIMKSEASENGFSEGDRVTVNPNIPCGICYYCQRGLQTVCDNLKSMGSSYDGGFAQYIAIPEKAIKHGCIFHIPNYVTFEEAALIDTASCAVNACEFSHVKPGDVVVIIGAGPAGCLNTEVSRVFGAQKIILIDISSKRLKLATFTEADIYINSSKEDPVDRVLQKTGGRGADVVIVACASESAQKQALKMVAKRGSVNFFGGLPKGYSTIQFDLNLVHYKESFITGTHGGSNRHCRIALDMIASRRIKAKEYISYKFGLSNFKEALHMAKERKGLKVFVLPNE
jgi:L-iditol 2-dehydrogenase